MFAPIGNLLQPAARLRVHVAEIGKRAERPEVLAHISDGTFDLTFFPSRSDMAGAWDETTFAGKGEKAWVEPYQAAFVFGYGSREIIEPKLAGAAAQRLESVDVAAHEGFEALAVGELQVHLATVAFHQAEGIQLARRSVVE